MAPFPTLTTNSCRALRHCNHFPMSMVRKKNNPKSGRNSTCITGRDHATQSRFTTVIIPEKRHVRPRVPRRRPTSRRRQSRVPQTENKNFVAGVLNGNHISCSNQHRHGLQEPSAQPQGISDFRKTIVTGSFAGRLMLAHMRPHFGILSHVAPTLLSFTFLASFGKGIIA